MDVMTGRSNGKTISLSMSIDDAGDKGGMGEMLRKIPVKPYLQQPSRTTTLQTHLPQEHPT